MNTQDEQERKRRLLANLRNDHWTVFNGDDDPPICQTDRQVWPCAVQLLFEDRDGARMQDEEGRELAAEDVATLRAELHDALLEVENASQQRDTLHAQLVQAQQDRAGLIAEIGQLMAEVVADGSRCEICYANGHDYEHKREHAHYCPIPDLQAAVAKCLA